MRELDFNGVKFGIDLDRDGLLVIHNAKTLGKYDSLVAKVIDSCSSTDEEYRKTVNEMIDKTKTECDPQEVYLYEYNNFECFYGKEYMAYNIVCKLYGEDIAKTIKRL